MNTPSELTFTSVLKWILLLMVLLFIIVYNWKRRWLYYYALKFPGPFGLPLLGIVHRFRHGPAAYNTIMKPFNEYPTGFSCWVGKDLYFGISKPKDIEILLNRCLTKGKLYKILHECFNDSLVVAPVGAWKERRKAFNKAFRPTTIKSFFGKFVKGAHDIVSNLNKKHGGESFDVLQEIWPITCEIAWTTLAGVDPNLLDGPDQFMSDVIRYQQIIHQRFWNPLYHSNFFWRRSALGREAEDLHKRTYDFIQKIVENSKEHDSGDVTENYFVNLLIRMRDEKKLSHEEMLREMPFMFTAANETTALTTSAVLLVLGMYPNIQENVFEELDTIFEKSDKDITLGEVNKMDYLKRVIKETMRLLPAVPFILRTLDQDVQIDSRFYPRGSEIIISMPHVHQNAEVWPDPLKFDPDRFLPEASKNRPRCAFMPFSYGVRNCIGLQYAMVSMLIMLSTILRSYKVTSSIYKRIEDIDFQHYVVAKPKKGYYISMEKRIK
ncbi:cytochrome P450 4C1-like isoform X2 [Tenebrio molitor]|uniref:cytochrome P450 4C1-like isoform X2 n=1 Tax=Tenebrio molitor TaxID=7067 RepID=UPI0036247184